MPAQGDTPNGRPQWPDVLAEIRGSETRVRSDIKDVKLDVKNLDVRVQAIEERRNLADQRTRDWFRAGSVMRTGLLLAFASIGSLLGLVNFFR